MSYEMKKSLRKAVGAKSYAQMQQEGEGQGQQEWKDRERQCQKQSIFEHKNWTLKEKIKLMIFLSHYHMLPDWYSERRSIHLYKHLSNFLKKTRTPEQCKNIHSLLKRKFNSLVEVVEALARELEHEEHYDRLTSKYERQLEKFQNQYGLYEGIGESRRAVEPIVKSRRVIEREEKQEPKPQVRVKQYDESLNQKVRYSDNIKFQQIQVQKPASRPSTESQFYFKEWLKCVSVIDYKNRRQEWA